MYLFLVLSKIETSHQLDSFLVQFLHGTNHQIDWILLTLLLINSRGDPKFEASHGVHQEPTALVESYKKEVFLYDPDMLKWIRLFFPFFYQSSNYLFD